MWHGVYPKGTGDGIFPFAFVRREENGRFLGPRVRFRGWDRLVGDGRFELLNRFADHGLARGREG